MRQPTPSLVIFGSARNVTCAVVDYSRRLCDAINARRPGFATLETIEPEHPLGFVGAIQNVLREDRIAHFQLPIEGWGNSLVPGSALMAARLATRKGRIAITLHEWTSLNTLRYLSIIPDILASDGFVFVSRQQRESFLNSPLVASAKKQAAPVIPIGPNIMPVSIDPERVAAERVKTRGVGAARAEIVIGFFGVLYASKRPDLLLRVVRVLKDRGVATRLLICGDFLWDKPKDREAFLALARELDVVELLDFRGRIDDEGELMATLSAADVFLLPFTERRQHAPRQLPGGQPARHSARLDPSRAPGRIRFFSVAESQDRQFRHRAVPDGRRAGGFRRRGPERLRPQGGGHRRLARKSLGRRGGGASRLLRRPRR